MITIAFSIFAIQIVLDFDCEELNDPSVYYKKLLELNPTSTLGNLARGAHLVKMGNMPEGIPILSAGTDVSAPNVYGLYMLTKAEVEAKNYSAVELSVASTVKHLDKVTFLTRKYNDVYITGFFFISSNYLFSLFYISIY